jgi:branched-chain amino acid transport system ATP-binding protein
MARALGDEFYIVDGGRTVHHGMMADLAGDEPLKQRYLGI